jgi:MSHA pilin protein MshD
MCISERAARRTRGFTLLELLLLVVVLAIALGGIITVYTTTVANSADPLVRKQAMAIAEAMMEEIMLQQYQEPSPATPHGATRDSFDSLDDYATPPYTSTGIVDLSGGTVPGLGSYNVAVNVAGPSTVDGVTECRLVTVTVTGPNVTVTLQGYRVNYP